ncbi:hypothetical protein BLNAU_1352 [Blattamonas nauphoetae]|uniref:Uncharacterized protein n=1 Tax=Blattamonas nauphoetae TaxID=2049346 RepID=A0ABQ9YJG0_9EUKA|nr:hypothetical protein BLNAU_1352 [Blattamonas nauphoetae]
MVPELAMSPGASRLSDECLAVLTNLHTSISIFQNYRQFERNRVRLSGSIQDMHQHIPALFDAYNIDRSLEETDTTTLMAQFMEDLVDIIQSGIQSLDSIVESLSPHFQTVCQCVSDPRNSDVKYHSTRLLTLVLHLAPSTGPGIIDSGYSFHFVRAIDESSEYGLVQLLNYFRLIFEQVGYYQTNIYEAILTGFNNNGIIDILEAQTTTSSLKVRRLSTSAHNKFAQSNISDDLS